MAVLDVVSQTINGCALCLGSCNKKVPVGHGDVLYVISYESDDDEILKNRGTVVREVACEDGLDYVCNIYIRTLLGHFKKACVSRSYASHLLGREVEDFETFNFRGTKIIAAINPCDIRVSQELGK